MLLVLRFLSKRLSAFCKWRSSASRFPCVWAGWPRHEVFLLWQHHRGAVSAEPVASRRQVHHQKSTGTARCVQSLQRTPMPKPLPLQARRHGNGKEQWKRVLAQAASGGSTATSTGGTTAASTTAPSAATTASSHGRQHHSAFSSHNRLLSHSQRSISHERAIANGGGCFRRPTKKTISVHPESSGAACRRDVGIWAQSDHLGEALQTAKTTWWLAKLQAGEVWSERLRLFLAWADAERLRTQQHRPRPQPQLQPAPQPRPAALQPQPEAREPRCSICLEEPPAMAVVPCWHFCLCLACSDGLALRDDRRCPVCRAEYDRFQRVFA